MKKWKTTLRNKVTKELNFVEFELFTFSEAASKSYTHRMTKSSPHQWEIISIILIGEQEAVYYYGKAQEEKSV